MRRKKPEAAHIRGICVDCKKNPQKKVGGKPDSIDKYYPICSQCNKKSYASVESLKKQRKRSQLQSRLIARPYLAFRKDKCERCGFIPEHICQLDVDHIDTDHFNNDPKNLQTLCANCHRFKTWQERQINPDF